MDTAISPFLFCLVVAIWIASIAGERLGMISAVVITFIIFCITFGLLDISIWTDNFLFIGLNILMILVTVCHVGRLSDHQKKLMQELHSQETAQSTQSAPTHSSPSAMIEAEQINPRTVEAAVQDRDSKFHTLLDMMGVAVFIVQGEKFVYVNPAAANITGYTEVEILEMHFLGAIHPNFRSVIRERGLARKRGEPVTPRYEMQILTKQQHARWLDFTAHVIDYQGRPAVLGMAVDITERKQIEESLYQTERRYHRLFDKAPVMYVVIHISPTGLPILEDCNELFLKTLGYNKVDVLQRPLTDFYTPKSCMDYYRSNYHQVLPDQVVTQERQLITNDGKIVETLLQAIPETDSQGKLMIRGMFVDITQRKQMEKILRAIAAGVSATTDDAFLRALLQQLASLLQMKCAFVGQLIKESSYQIATTLILNNNCFINNLTFDVRDTPCKHVIETRRPYCYAQGVKQAFPFHGLLIDLEVESYMGVPLLNRDGQVIGVVTVMDSKPINQEKSTLVESMLQIFASRVSAELERMRVFIKLQQERSLLTQHIQERTAKLSEANAQLVHALQVKDEFLANMSHELRTPLNAILGLCELLQMNVYGRANDKQIEAIRIIENNGYHLLGLINDILDLSSVEAGDLVLTLSATNVKQISETSLNLIRQTAQQKHINLITEFAENVTFIQADERRLKQILGNLLSNAVKFTPKGGSIGLRVTGDVEKGQVYFTVWDTGIGISEKDRLRLFRSFVQLDGSSTRIYGGIGLGLSLVNHLVELHGGTISVESTVGKGSRFTVALPW